MNNNSSRYLASWTNHLIFYVALYGTDVVTPMAQVGLPPNSPPRMPCEETRYICLSEIISCVIGERVFPEQIYGRSLCSSIKII